MSEGITFLGVIASASLQRDGGWKLTFEISADDAKAVVQLAQMQNTLMQVACIPVDEA